MSERHPGCDTGVHGVEVTRPTCGHSQASTRSPCPVCGSRPAVAIAMAYNESMLDHIRLQRAYAERSLRERARR